MSSKIEGVPDGWELVAFRRAMPGDFFLNNRGLPERWSLTDKSTGIFAVIRKIEKPKQYRPFANAVEFEPHRDRWVIYTSPVDGREAFYKISAFDSERVWLGPDNCGRSHREAFDCLRFESGQPFGVEVTE